MAVTSVVKLSELEGATRMDAEFYQPKYLKVHHAVIKTEHVKIGEIVERCKKGIFDIKAEKYVSSGIPFIRISNLKDGLIDDADMVFITPGIHQKEIKTEFHRNEIVLSKTAYPAASIVFFDRYNISQDIIGISLKNSWKTKLLAPYIVAFLNSKYGLPEMQQWFQGNIQMHFALPDVKRIIIPILSQNIQENISGLYLNAYEEIRNSKILYAQAENLLLEELGLKDCTPKYELSYTANLSKAFGVHRVDAEYFQPAYNELIENLMNFEVKKLGKLAYRKRIKINPNPDKNYGYIEISDISTDIGEINYSERQGKELPPNARIPIDGGELIVSKVRPTRGAIGIIPEGLNKNVICSSAFSVFTAQSPLKEYLYIVSRSIIGRLQMERPTTGTSYPTINDKDVENIKVPILSDEIQQKIASHVQQLHEARRKAKELLEDAKRKVEAAIEK